MTGTIYRTTAPPRGLRPLAAVILAAAVAACYPEPSAEEAAQSGETSQAVLSLPKPQFLPDGSLEKPTGYRQWVFVGAPLTPNSQNPPEAPFPEFHTVYMHPDDFAYAQRTGEFRDGTVLIKELIAIGATEASSGNGYFMGGFNGLEAAVKDRRRFANEPGNWAYFSFGHSYPLAEATAKQDVGSCNACHQEFAADDYVFTQYYPILTAFEEMRVAQAD